MAYTPTTAHAGTQAAINGLLDQMGVGPVQGRMPRVEPLVATPRRATPLVAQRLPVLGPEMPGARRAMPMFADRSLAGAGQGLPPLPGGPPPTPGVPAARSLVHVPGLGTSMSSAEILAGQAAGGAAKGGRMAGLVGGAKNLAGKLPGGALSAKYANLGMAGKIGVGAGLSIGGNMLAEQLGGNETTQGKFAKGAASWAPWGLVLGPKGAVVAGLAGGIQNVLFGGDDDGGGKLEDKVATYMSSMGIADDEQAGIMSLYELEKEALGEDAAKQSLMARVGTYEQQRMMAEQQAQEDAVAQQRMLASQALAGQFFQPFAQQMVQSAQQRHQMLQNILPTLPENFRGVAAAQSAAALDNATRMATAYQAQAQMIPAMAGMQNQQEQVNSLASQLLQQGIQSTITPQSTDLTALLQGQ